MGLFDRFTKHANRLDATSVKTAPTEIEKNETTIDRCPKSVTADGVAYAFIDVETPNRYNDRICSIGVIRTDSQGNILGETYALVDPDEEFDAANVSVHGITEFDVHRAPLFPAVWNEIRPLLHGAKLIAHNAQFDLTVLDKTLSWYGIDHGPVEYACTMTMAGEQMHGLERYRLETVCEACGVPLCDHHNAMEDAAACMGVFFSLGQPKEWTEYIPLSQRQRNGIAFNVEKSENTKAHNELMKHAMDIIEDGHVSLEEAIGLRWWLEKNASLSDDRTVEQLLATLSSVLEDGTIDPGEESELISTLSKIVNPVTDNDFSGGIDGKKFCLTGEFDFGSKDEVASRLESLGGIESKNVTKTCNYVIVGNRGSAAYAHGNYGGKVKKAMEWQAKGVPMEIISETECPWL